MVRSGLFSYLKFSCLISVAIDKCESAPVVVKKCANSLVFIHHLLCLWDHHRAEFALWLPGFIRTDILCPGQVARLENLALDARFQVFTLVRAGETLLAPLTTVLPLLRLLAPALPTLALPVLAADLSNVPSKRRDASVVGGLALTGGEALHVPLRATLALPANACPMVLTRA